MPAGAGRWEPFMKRTLIRSCVFVATFLLALILDSMLLNKGNTDMTAELKDSELPLVFIDVRGRQVNMMQGFLTRMDEKYMHKGIISVGENRRLSISVKTYGRSVKGLDFEVRSIDGERLVEDTPIAAFSEGDVLHADITLKDLIDRNTEYTLTFRLTLDDGRVAYYYTRIIQAANYGMEEKLDFVADFSAATFRADGLSDLGQYMETSREGDNTTLSHVTINSSLKQIGWGGLEVERVTEPVYTIQDITEQTAAITVEYLVRYMRYERENEARVKEVYRVRTGEERMFLLEYDRTMSEIFTEEATSFVDDRIMLGILDPEIGLTESDGGKVLAFSQAGVLYSLNMMDYRLARLFSLYGEETTDERSLYGDHDFKILQVDETGNVVFMVYGYISRGRWEGYCGAVVYYYNGATNTIEEMAFLPSAKSPELLEAEMNQLCYMNGKNELYVFLNDRISRIRLDGRSVEVIAENLSGGNCQISESNQNIVWQNEDGERGGVSLTLMNLNSGEQTTIEAGSGNYILPLGFMGEDLIYGVARREDVVSGYTGQTVFPMYRIRIQDEGGEILMTYEKPGIYVTGCRMNENQIILDRVEKDETGGYTACAADQIVSGVEAQPKSNVVITMPTEDYEKLTAIQMGKGLDGKRMKFLTPREVLYEGDREVLLPPSGEEVESYYVYGLDGKAAIVFSPREAIGLADDTAGVVTGRDGSYVWRRERINTKNQIMAIEAAAVTEERGSLAVCLDEILRFEGTTQNTQQLLNQGEAVTRILEENLHEAQILDLSGCSLESVLYYPDREAPVLALLADGNAVLLTGFNEMQVVVMDPQAGTLEKMGINDAAAWFEENGNLFISYVRK